MQTSGAPSTLTGHTPRLATCSSLQVLQFPGRPKDRRKWPRPRPISSILDNTMLLCIYSGFAHGRDALISVPDRQHHDGQSVDHCIVPQYSPIGREACPWPLSSGSVFSLLDLFYFILFLASAVFLSLPFSVFFSKIFTFHNFSRASNRRFRTLSYSVGTILGCAAKEEKTPQVPYTLHCGILNYFGFFCFQIRVSPLQPTRSRSIADLCG